MGAVLVWRPDLAGYDFGEGHRLDPVRVTLSVALMRDYGMLCEGKVVAAEAADDDTLQLMHSPEYVAAVRQASADITRHVPSMGIGTSDNPAFPRMHDVSALVAGASVTALRGVLDETCPRAFSIAGGLHHAHRSRAAGFCVYNDPAIAILAAKRDRPDIRVLYVDIDAHHGDGVQEAFWDRRDVMTVSLHETGAFLFPGTGASDEIGEGDGLGFAVNVPLPPYATDECYRLALENVVEPLADVFRPAVIVAQLGADALHGDPLTQLGLTMPGYRWLVRRIIGLSDQLCGGKLCALGGGGYAVHADVPRAWTWVMAALDGDELPEPLPEEWRARVRGFLGRDAPETLDADEGFELPRARRQMVVEEARDVIRRTRQAVFPYHGLTP